MTSSRTRCLRVCARVIALACLPLAVASCGGGAGEPQAAHASRPLRAQASDQLPDRLMDFAEATFPQLFPGHPETMAADPFVFRYYPSTGIYLGVVVNGGTSFVLDGVYVFGGPFNAITYVGPATSFVGGGKEGTTGVDNGCFALELADKEGTTSRVVYELSGTSNGMHTVETSVGGLVEYQGHQARETTTTTVGSSVIGNTALTFTTVARSYAARTANVELTHYGTDSTTNSTTAATKLETIVSAVADPPWVNRVAALALGESLTMTQTQSLTTKVSGLPEGTVTNTSTDTATLTVRYVERETIAVPAGSINTCKFETTKAQTGVTVTTWVAVGTGLTVKSASESQSSVATSVTFNGQPL